LDEELARARADIAAKRAALEAAEAERKRREKLSAEAAAKAKAEADAARARAQDQIANLQAALRALDAGLKQEKGHYEAAEQRARQLEAELAQARSDAEQQRKEDEALRQAYKEGLEKLVRSHNEKIKTLKMSLHETHGRLHHVLEALKEIAESNLRTGQQAMDVYKQHVGVNHDMTRALEIEMETAVRSERIVKSR
jgi:fused signal recognition particle receptor